MNLLNKPLPRRFTFLFILPILSISGLEAASVIHGVSRNVSDFSAPETILDQYYGWGSAGDKYLYTPDAGGLGSVTVKTGLAGTVDGEMFTYDVVFTVLALGTGGRGTAFDEITSGADIGKRGIIVDNGRLQGVELDGLGGQALETGDSFSITINNISNANVSFDGFVNFSTLGAANLADKWVFNGNTYQGTVDTFGGDLNPDDGVFTGGSTGAGNGTSDPVLSGGVATFEITGGNTSAFEGIAYQFSSVAVPEPTSSMLLCVAGVGLLSRRAREV